MLTALALSGLDNLFEKMPRVEIQLGAHTDSQSSFEFNMDLIQKRVDATLQYLLDNGINRNHHISRCFG